MNSTGIKGLMELTGADEERAERIEKLWLEMESKEAQGKEHLDLDFTKGDIKGNQKKLMDAMRKALWTFDNVDEVEIDMGLINEDMVELIWKNLDIYTYDIESFFLNKFIFYLKDEKKVMYKMYFSIEDGNIFLFVKNHDLDFTCGTILVKDGKFIPCGAIHDNYVDSIIKQHMAQKIPWDRKLLGDRTLMNCLLYIIIVNQMVNQNKEVITETSRRVELSTKKKGKKKTQPKRTKQIRYIKVDTQKVRKIQEEYERTTRDSYHRHIAEWSRRGYWMTTRSGERKWVKPTTCHARDKVGEKIQKLYKIK